MANYASKDAAENWEQFRAVYNRCTVFAPYTVPLTDQLLERYVFPYMQAHSTYARIGAGDDGEGIIHAGLYTHNGATVGHIMLFFADSNAIARRLLAEAEAWLKERGAARVYGFWWFPSPYAFILHGRETYAWAGAFPANNALRRGGYDLLNDIVVMQLRMDGKPAVVLPDIPGIAWKTRELDETELAWTGRVEAHSDNKPIGHCEYYELKAISKHLNKAIGQITIDTDRAYYGTGVAKALIGSAHAALYERGCRQVMLATSQGLFRAIKFYEKLGYRPEAIRAYAYVKEDFLHEIGESMT